MGIFDKLKNAFSSNYKPDNEFDNLLNTQWQESEKKKVAFWSLDLSKQPIWTDTIKNWPDKKKVGFCLFAIQKISKLMKGKRSYGTNDKDWQLQAVCGELLQLIFRNKLLMDEEDAIQLYLAFKNNSRYDWSSFTQWPVNLFVNQLERQYKGQPLPAGLKDMLLQLQKDINNINENYQQKERIKLAAKIEALVFSSENKDEIKPARLLGNDRLADKVNSAIEAMPVNEKQHWYHLLPLAQKASGSKPSAKFLTDTKALITAIGTDKYKKTIHDWLQFLVDLKETEEKNRVDYGDGRYYEYTSYDYLSAVNAEAVKGLVWTCAHFHDAVTIQTIAALAERAYRKIPGKGPTAASVGNACLYVLYKSKGLDGVGQLSRLKLRIKQGSTQNQIDNYLQAAAEEQGVTVSEIEDMAVEDFGLQNGSRIFLFDDYKCELIITGVGKTEQRWYKPDGSPQKSVPAIVKEKHSAKWKKLKDTAKQAEQTLVAQRDRIDRLFRDGRTMSRDHFQQYYLSHGLMQYLAHKIIWNFHSGDKIIQAIFLNNYWVNAANEIAHISTADTVSLWHPAMDTVASIKSWREFFVFHQLQQPLKQAYREVYLLTDAELNTRTYSNRMAAHILRQHQFNSLAKARGWRYALMGAFDNGMDSGIASLALPQYQLRAEYWINEVNADNETNDTGIWNYVSTDQVRFIHTATNEITELANVPPLVFSEVMRDVDLFVGVASVGNDPAWSDNGGLPAYRDYWQSYSFGELSEVAKNRKEILSSLVPRLKIRDIAAVKDKFLVVKGKLRTYKIHIGSTNILMEPNDQYLCIVPDRSAKSHTENVFLPFEGDSGLSIILSKAFLLADDDKIKDTTITSQINKQ